MKKQFELNVSGNTSTSGKSIVLHYSTEKLFSKVLVITVIKDIDTKKLPDDFTEKAIGNNVKASVTKGILSVSVDMDAPPIGTSSTGKSMLYSNTGGFVGIGNGFKVSVLLRGKA